ncbi:MAG: helix-turn-helix domain-containing protein [Lachnospiraceae bacterium]|nr:helix-turn-helix domain-containing protein [Lachnospiraceae bacterium]
MNFAEKILGLRTKSGLSQEALAEKLMVSRQAVSKWESGVTLPETEKLIIISNMFGVSLDYLLKEDLGDRLHSRSTENLDRVILRFLGSAQDIDEISKMLIDIIQDGVIDDEEREKINSIMVTLDEITRNIQDIKLKMTETGE